MDYYSNDLCDDNEVYRFYLIKSRDQLWRKDITLRFETFDKAMNYAINSRVLPPFAMWANIIYDKGGRLSSKTIGLGKIPNQRERVVTNYVLIDQDNEDLNILYNYGSWVRFDPKKHNIILKDEWESINNIGLYKVIVTLNDKNELEYKFEFCYNVKENGVKKRTR